VKSKENQKNKNVEPRMRFFCNGTMIGYSQLATCQVANWSRIVGLKRNLKITFIDARKQGRKQALHAVDRVQVQTCREIGRYIAGV